MALDGIFLHMIRREIEAVAIGARVDRIAQPSREEILLHLRWRGDGGKLLLSAGAQSPRVHFTRHAPENPKAPPMFCMLLRKHLSGARLSGLRQVGLDRILLLDFETVNELGDPATITLAMEIMGRHSNLIVIGQDGRIIDAIKRVDLETSSVRQVLPGMRYVLPPAQDKYNLLEAEPAAIVERIAGGRPVELSKSLMDALQGVSPLVCREIAHYAARGREVLAAEIGGEQRERLAFFLGEMRGMVRDGRASPTMVLDESGRPKDFSWLPIHQYGAAMLTREMESCSALLDEFYVRRDAMERMRQRSGDLLRLLANTSERIARKLSAQRQELLECAGREQLKIKGDLISANLYTLQKGDAKAVLQNFYDPDGGELEIRLDPQLTPPQNAQRYYSLYRKAATAEKKLRELVVQGEAEYEYIDSVFDALTRATVEADLEAIRGELEDGGYLRRRAAAGKRKKEEKLPPLRYRSTDGFTVLAGRNNVQNDRLTLRESRNHDLWMHTQKIPGSHVIVVGEGKEIPRSTIEQACVIAAYNSKARESSKVPVDYTQVRNVRKPGGAKPGMVVYDQYRTVLVDPDEALVQSLRERAEGPFTHP